MSGWSRVPAHRRVTVGRLSCIVDGFKYAGSHCTHYFLSHFHSDHYTGLSDAFHHGLIHCSRITARLLPTLGVYAQYIAAHDFDSPFVLEDVQLTLTEANHCPGAALILFQQLRQPAAEDDCTDDEPSGSSSKRRRVSGSDDPLTCMVPATTGEGTLLHTGDFRFDEGMKLHPCLRAFRPDILYLDTTYSSPSFLFPLQSASIAHLLRCITAHLSSSTLFVISTYVIGKEKIFRSVAAAFGCRIYVSARKYRVLQLMGERRLDRFTTDCSQSRFHIAGWSELGETWPFYKPNFRNCDVHLARYNDGVMHQDELRQQEEDAKLPPPPPPTSPPAAAASSSSHSSLSCDVNSALEGADGSFPFITAEHRRLAQSCSPSYSSIVGFVPTGWVHHKSSAFPPAILRKVDSGSFQGGVRRRSQKQKQAEAEVKQMHRLTAAHRSHSGDGDGGIGSSLASPPSPPSSTRSSSSSAESSLAPHVIYLVPYSEHSSYAELQSCVQFFRPRLIVPTVFADERHSQRIVSMFRNAVDRTANVRSFLQRFGASAADRETAQPHDVGLPPQEQKEVIEVDAEAEEAEVQETPTRQSKDGHDSSSGTVSWYCHACQHAWSDVSAVSTCQRCSSSFIEQRAEAAAARVTPSTPPKSSPSPEAGTRVSPVSASSIARTSSSSAGGGGGKSGSKQLSLSAFFPRA